MMPDAAQDDLYVSYTLFDDVYPRTLTPRTDVVWKDLVNRVLHAREYPAKEACPLISMCEYGNTPSLKGYIRHGGNVVRCFGVELDYDQEKIGLKEASDVLQRAGIAGIFYTSASHSTYKPRWRVLLPLSEPALPEKRAEYVGRVNRLLGGVASSESFALSQSFYIGRVKGREYEVRETTGRCIDMAADIEPLYPESHNEMNRDTRTDDELRQAFVNGQGRYEAMQKLSARAAFRGMEADDIQAVLHDWLGQLDTHNKDGIDLRSRVEGLATSAVHKFGGKRPKLKAQEPPLTKTTTVDADLPFVDLRDMHAHLTDTYVIKNFLPAKAEAWVLGMPGSGKTFLVTDMALHIANNLPWMGHKVKGGLVVYVGAENARSVERRFTGARDNKPEFKVDAPLVLTPGPVDLKNDTSLEAIMRTVRAAETRHNQKCVLVVVDTLSRAGGGKEDTEDFGACLRGCGRLKLELDTSVMLVHHLGKDPTRGGRGWSGINGGVDLEVLVTEEQDLKVATVTKARDGQDGERIGFSLESVNIGQDIDGDIVTTCVVRSVNAPVAEIKKPSGKHQTAILAEAEAIILEHPTMVWSQTELLEMCRGLEISSSSARKAILNLRELGYFQPTIGGTKLSYHPLGGRGKREK